MKFNITNGIRLTKVRKNGTQKCCWCSGSMVEGTYNISFGSQNMYNHKNIWLHIKCAEAFLNKLKNELPTLKEKAALEAL